MRSVRISLSIGLALAMVLALGQLTASASPLIAADIVFDGFCDGMHLNIPSTGLGTAATVDGYQTGCLSAPIVGTTSTKPSAAHITTDSGAAGAAFHYLINANHTFAAYDASGPLFFVTSGTWSAGTARRGATGRASSASGARTTAPGGTAGGYDISFNGYCDGMHLYVPSAGVGTANTVDGYHTGCITGGFGGTTSRKPKALRLSDTYGGTALYAWQINADHTWAAYTQDAGVIVIAGLGSWSPGTPPPTRGAGPALG